tara:strand:+ start:105 stop:530 length:426 start_codon:yes stop_codon:yes gene_type:complete
MTQYLSEILNEFETKKTRKAKVTFLKQHKNNASLAFLFQGTYDPRVKWRVNVPSYVPDDAPVGMNQSNLYTELSKCSIFVKGHPKGQHVKNDRLDVILLQILESMHAGESLLFEQMLNKDLKVEGLTEKLVLEVFPNLLEN